MKTLTDPFIALERHMATLARSRRPEGCAWAPLKFTIVECARALRLLGAAPESALDLGPVLAARRIISVGTFESPDATEAALIPTRGGFEIRMRRELSPRRARFDIAHEIGHTLFYDIGASPPRRLLQPGDAAKMSVKEESLCSEFARQLLVPVEHLPQLIRDRVQERPTEFVSEISRRYMVSSHVALRCLLSETRDFARSVAIVAGQSPSMQARCFWGRQMRRPRKDERDLIRRVEHALVNGDRARLRELDYNQFLAKIDIGQEIKSGRAFRIAILSFQP